MPHRTRPTVEELPSPTGDTWLVRLQPDGQVLVNPDLDRDELAHAVSALVGRIRWLTARQRGTTTHLRWPRPAAEGHAVDREVVRRSPSRLSDPNDAVDV